MTRHNLRDHLDWLLHNQQPASPPIYSIVEARSNSATQDLAISRRQSLSEQSNAADGRNVGSTHADHEFVRPPLPEKARDIGRQGHMAKLTSAHKSSKRRLLSNPTSKNAGSEISPRYSFIDDESALDWAQRSKKIA